MFNMQMLSSILALVGLGIACVNAAPSPIGAAGARNVTGTATMPALSPELFKWAVSAPYVFTVFTAASDSNMFVYTSNDATTFSLLKGPAYIPPTGLIRDPSLIYHTE